MLAAITHFLATVPEPYYSWLNWMANAVRLTLHPERVEHPGTLHPDKTFYILDNLSNYVGLAGWYDIVLGYLKRAQKKGWTLVVVPVKPLLPGAGDWNTYFKQPSDIPLADALRGKNVVRAALLGAVQKRYNKKEIALRHRLASVIPFRDEVDVFIKERLPKIFDGVKHPMVAVMFRGTDYRVGKGYCPVGHAKVPNIEWFCDRVETDLKKWGVYNADGSNLFVVTEEQESLDAIKQRFPACRFVAKERFANFKPGKYLACCSLPNVSPKENNILYLLDIVAMSKCNYLIGGINGGVLMALNLNGNRYKAVDILNTGVN